MSRRYIITSEPPLESFRRGATASGLKHVVTFPPEGNNPYQEAWADQPRTAVLQFVFERPLELCYFFVDGEPTSCAFVMSHMIQELSYIQTEHLLEMIRATSDDEVRVRACNALAVAEPTFNVEIFTELVRCSTEPDERLRTAAVRALGYLRWEQARPTFVARMEEDASAFVREAARLSLEDLSLPRK